MLDLLCTFTRKQHVLCAIRKLICVGECMCVYECIHLGVRVSVEPGGIENGDIDAGVVHVHVTCASGK